MHSKNPLQYMDEQALLHQHVFFHPCIVGHEEIELTDTLYHEKSGEQVILFHCHLIIVDVRHCS